MAVALRTQGTVNDGLTAGTSNAPVAIPADAQVGDVLVLLLVLNYDPALITWTLPAGWTQHAIAGVTTVGTATAFTKTIASGEPGTTQTISANVSRRIVGSFVVFSGAKESGVLVAAQGSDTTGSSTFTLPSLTDVPTGAGLAGMVGIRRSSSPALLVTAATSYTEVAESRSAVGNSPEFTASASYKVAGAAGTYGGESGSTDANSQGRMTYLVAVPDALPTTSGSLSGDGTLSGTTEVVQAVTGSLSGAGTLSGTTVKVTAQRRKLHQWAAFARTADYRLSRALPLHGAEVVLRHFGVNRAVVTVPYSKDNYDALAPSQGLVLYRDGVIEFTGLVSSLRVSFTPEGRDTITAHCVGDAQHLEDRLVFPDPLRAADDQTVNDYWTFTGVASTAMRQLISDQAGATALADRQVSGLTLGVDPAVGASRTYKLLFTGLLEELANMSAVSGADLGLRVTGSAGSLVVDIYVPRDLSSAVRFSTDLSNLTSLEYGVTAPTTTRALVAGQGDLKARVRKLVSASASETLAWARQVWRYIDRRDTALVADLTAEGDLAIAEGVPETSLALTLLDSDAAAYRTDWLLGDKVTVYVGRPGETIATVSAPIRELTFTVDEDGAETIRPALGTADARTFRPSSTTTTATAARTAVAGLIARK